MTLRLKVNLVLLATFLVGLGLSAIFVHQMSVSAAKQAQRDEALIMMGEAHATIHYTDAEVAPLLAAQMKMQFLPQGIPFFAAAESFRLLTRSFPNYTFHQATTNPTNPLDRPAPWEAAIIQTFRNPSPPETLISERETPSGTILSYALPIKVTDSGCLSCHSTPEAAPAPMVDVYGSKNGFGWHLGDVVGATIVSVPEAGALAHARHLTLAIVGWLVLAFAVMLALVNALLTIVVIRPIRHITDLADRVSLGDFTAPEFNVGARDEIGSLATSFNRMRRSLENAMKMLDD